MAIMKYWCFTENKLMPQFGGVDKTEPHECLFLVTTSINCSAHENYPSTGHPFKEGTGCHQASSYHAASDAKPRLEPVILAFKLCLAVQRHGGELRTATLEPVILAFKLCLAVQRHSWELHTAILHHLASRNTDLC